MNNQQQGQRTHAELAKLIKAFETKLAHNGPQKATERKDVETMFDVRLPQDYRQFLGSYGALAVDDIVIFGLGEAGVFNRTLAEMILMLRLAHPDIPLELVPIEELEPDHFACLVCNQGKSGHSPMVLLNLASPQPVNQLPRLAPCFRDYLYNRLLMVLAPEEEMIDPQKSPQATEKGLAVLEKHVRKYQARFGYDHATGGKMPRNHDWRPYRFCIQDVLFGATVVRHLREDNCLQVDVFLTADIPEYGPLAGAHALISFLLSEAYKCGGTMEIRFTENDKKVRVPGELQDLGEQYGIIFSQANKGRILPAEAKALYAALTDFSPELQERINQLEQAGQLKMARACYVVHHGVWSKEQVEMIILGSQRPDSILGGFSQPQQRHLYLHDLYHARAALLGGMLDRRLAKHDRYDDDGTPYDLEDDIRRLTISFGGGTYIKRYQSNEPMPMPWLYSEERALEIPADVPFRVLVRPRDRADLMMHLPADIKLAGKFRQHTDQPVAILVPHDFTSLPGGFDQKLVEQVQTAHVGLIVCPESISALDTEAAQKLARSRILRQ